MTCAKRKVFCTILTLDGGRVIAQNSCDNPQEVCPRNKGEDYEKCTSVCAQNGHAEMQALRCAKSHRFDLRGAKAILRGHSYACRECQEALFDEGIYLTVRQQWSSDQSLSSLGLAYEGCLTCLVSLYCYYSIIAVQDSRIQNDTALVVTYVMLYVKCRNCFASTTG